MRPAARAAAKAARGASMDGAEMIRGGVSTGRAQGMLPPDTPATDGRQKRFEDPLTGDPFAPGRIELVHKGEFEFRGTAPNSVEERAERDDTCQ